MAKNKYIETPEVLLNLFEKYVKVTKSNPIKVTDWVGGMAVEVERRKEKPLTIEGFSVYCFKEVGCVKPYFNNTEKRYEEYVTICSHIKEQIRLDQIEGGMAGIYNPSITQRLNGLKESVDTTQRTEQPLFGNDKEMD